MSNRGAISVIIPNYNRASLIGDTIENMLGQSLPPKEVIVVDDGSTDNSVKVITGFGSRVTLIRQENQGPGAARNTGYEVSTGDFIQFMDSDDLVSKNKLEVQLKTLQETEADLAYGPWIRTKISGCTMEFTGPLMQGGPLPSWKSMLEWQMGAWCLIFQNCLLRRSVMELAGRFRTDLMPSEDSEFLVRLLLAGAKPVYTGECLTFYREHNHAQITSSGTTQKRRAEDWTHYLEIVGGKVFPLLSSFHMSTKMEIALNVRRHQRYCKKNQWKVLHKDEPLCQCSTSMPVPIISFYDLWDRTKRRLCRISSATPTSEGMELRVAGRHERALALELGYAIA